MEKQVEVAIIGAGSAGLTACGQVRKRTDSWVLIDGGELGTTCARVGCMPSKAAIQVAEDFHRRAILSREGIEGGEGLSLDRSAALEFVEDMRDHFVDQVLANSIDEMQPDEEFIESNARFVSANELEIDGGRIKADKIIIATGSTPIVPQAWRAFGERVLTTDEFFELDELPDSVAVIGLGVIGLELGQTLARWGLDVTGFDQAGFIGHLSDPEINRVAIDVIGKEFPLHLGQAAELSEGTDGKLRVTAGGVSVEVDKVLVCIGRRPNVHNLGLENTGAELDDQGVPLFNPNTMQVGDLPIYIAGDITSTQPILHEANIEGRIAGYNATQQQPTAFKRKTTFTITFSDPNIAHVGLRYEAIDPDTTVIGVGRFAPLGRALIMGKNKGMLHLYADKNSGVLLGATIFGPRGENLGHLLCWCIEQHLTVADLLRMPFYHPTIEEGLQSALYDLKGKLGIERDYPVELMPL